MNIFSKTLIACIFALFLISAVNAQEANGFRDLKWGASQTDEFTKLPFSDTFMRRKIDILKIGDAPITNIWYSFDNNQLSAVSINFSGYENSKKILDALTVKYGKPDKSYPTIGDYLWTSHSTTLISLDYTSYKSTGAVLLISKEMAAKKDAEDKIKAKKAVDDL